MFDTDDVDEAKRMLPIYKPAVDLLEIVSGKKTEQAEQEPVAFVSEVYQSRYTLEWNGRSLPVGTLLYASPVCTKDLTDEEQLELARSSVGKSRHWLVAAVIAKYKEKNK